MKNIRLLSFVLIIGTLVLSACGAVTATPTAAPDAAKSAKVDAMPVSFVGIVDSMAGDQWVISGTTMTVDASIVRDGPFNVGDQVKVEGLVNPDGSFTISRVEAPTPQEAATLPPLSVDNSNDSSINANTNDSNVNDANINDDSSSGVNSNDDNSNATNSNDSNINDDNGGGNTNDDNSNASNDNGDDNGSNDNGDDSGGGSSNDDKGGDDNSSKGGGDDNGGDDKGDNSNDD